VKIGRSFIVFILKVFTDDGVFMLLDGQVEMTARVAYIIRITRRNYIEIHSQRVVGLQVSSEIFFKTFHYSIHLSVKLGTSRRG